MVTVDMTCMTWDKYSENQNTSGDYLQLFETSTYKWPTFKITLEVGANEIAFVDFSL